MRRDLDTWIRATLLVLGFAGGVYWRVDGIREAALFGDECHTLRSCQGNLTTILSTFDGLGSHVVLPLAQKLSLALFGDGIVSFRLVALVPGILTLFLCYPLARAFVGPTSALLATLALAVSPIHVYYSRFARSYALGVLFGFLLAYFLLRVLHREHRTRAAWAAVVVLAAILPYTHLTSAGFVATLALGALALSRGQPGKARRTVLAFGVAAVIVAALYAPLFLQVRHYFVEAIPEEDKALPKTWIGIPVLLAGGVIEGFVWLVGVPLGLVLLWRSKRDAALLCAAGILGPLAVLAATLPRGMEYAYARYLLNGLPFMLILVAEGWVRAAGFAWRGSANAERIALALGVLGIAVSSLSGPLGPAQREKGTFSNTYLAMRKLPAFDEPWPGRSSFYDALAAESESATIVEVPPMLSRAVLLQRNLQLLHGKEVRVAWPEALPAALRGGPYAELDSLSHEDGDYLIVHRDPRSEVDAYWAHVYRDVWPKLRSSIDRGFMQLQKNSYVHNQRWTDPEEVARFAASMRERLGPTSYKDEWLLVWKLTP